MNRKEIEFYLKFHKGFRKRHTLNSALKMSSLQLNEFGCYPLWEVSSHLEFTIGRLMHGIVFSFMKPNMFFRIGGMALTFSGFIGLITLSAIHLFS